ncbi:MAG: hypothetical protein LKH97_08450, partial [Levilactobacillus sp.]|nr:hypothetical protein [Levilactobacillus sp.]
IRLPLREILGGTSRSACLKVASWSKRGSITVLTHNNDHPNLCYLTKQDTPRQAIATTSPVARGYVAMVVDTTWLW